MKGRFIPFLALSILGIALQVHWASGQDTPRKSATMKQKVSAISGRIKNLRLRDADDIRAADKILASIAEIEPLPSDGSAGPVNIRELKTRLFLQFLNHVESHIDGEFETIGVEDRPTLNVLPPAGRYPARSGMSPDDIRDPRLRKQYEEAIQANSARAIRFMLQERLRMACKNYVQHALYPFIAINYNKSIESDQQELDKLLSEEVSSDELRGQLINELEEYRKHPLPVFPRLGEAVYEVATQPINASGSKK